MNIQKLTGQDKKGIHYWTKVLHPVHPQWCLPRTHPDVYLAHILILSLVLDVTVLQTGRSSPLLLPGRFVPQTPHAEAPERSLVSLQPACRVAAVRSPEARSGTSWAVERHLAPLSCSGDKREHTLGLHDCVEHRLTVAMATLNAPHHSKTRCRLSKNTVCCLQLQAPLRSTTLCANGGEVFTNNRGWSVNYCHIMSPPPAPSFTTVPSLNFVVIYPALCYPGKGQVWGSNQAEGQESSVSVLLWRLRRDMKPTDRLTERLLLLLMLLWVLADRLRPCQPLLRPQKRQPTHGCDSNSDITKLCIGEKCPPCMFRSLITTTESDPVLSSALHSHWLMLKMLCDAKLTFISGEPLPLQRNQQKFEKSIFYSFFFHHYPGSVC